MILEAAILSVKPGQAPAFEAAMAAARPLIESTKTVAPLYRSVAARTRTV